MADKYEITSSSPDMLTLGLTSTVKIRDTETGRTGSVNVLIGDSQAERDQIGREISNGNVAWDNDEDDDDDE